MGRISNQLFLVCAPGENAARAGTDGKAFSLGLVASLNFVLCDVLSN